MPRHLMWALKVMLHLTTSTVTAILQVQQVSLKSPEASVCGCIPRF